MKSSQSYSPSLVNIYYYGVFLTGVVAAWAAASQAWSPNASAADPLLATLQGPRGSAPLIAAPACRATASEEWPDENACSIGVEKRSRQSHEIGRQPEEPPSDSAAESTTGS